MRDTWEKNRRNRCYTKAMVILANAHPTEKILEYDWAKEEGRRRVAAMQQVYAEIRRRHPDEFRRIYEELLKER